MEKKELIKTIIMQIKNDAELKLDSDKLVSDGILDSLDIMNLIMKLEDEFNIEIDPEDVLSENFESISAITTLIEKCEN